MHVAWHCVTDERSLKAVMKIMYGKELPARLKVPGPVWIKIRQASGAQVYQEIGDGVSTLCFEYKGITFI